MNDHRQLAAWLPSVSGVALILALLPGCSRSTDSTSSSPVRLNEIMSRNQSFPVMVDDGAGPRAYFADWVEIHNRSTATVSLAGYGLSDRRNTPDEFEFPSETVVPPGGYLVVFLLDPENCASDCEVEAAECRRDAGSPAEEAACDVALAACREECRPRGLVSGFNLSDEGETLFLFADRGRFLADQRGVRNQPPDVANGVDPETGEYGVIYLPTPGAENERVNFKGPRFLAPPRAVVTVDPALPIQVPFTIDRDTGSPGPFEVIFEHAAVADCGSALPEEGVTTVRLSPVREEEVLETRLDAGGNPIAVPVRRAEYAAQLPPPVTCGARRAYRVLARDGALELEWLDCVTACEVPPTVIVNEYQPNNTKIRFSRTRGDGTTEVTAPDWIEIWNHGDAPADIRSLGLVGRTALAEGRFASWLFGREGGVTEPLAPGSFLLVLADDDGGDFRREYRRESDPDGKVYFSTRFALDAVRQAGNPPDTFALVRPANPADPLSVGGEVLDRVVLDFASVLYVPDQSAGRFPDIEGVVPDALAPGTVSSCPTPELENLKTCDVPPAFLDEVAIETAAGPTRCPGAGQPVTIRASVGFDADTPPDQISAEVLFRLDEAGAELPAGEVVLARAPDEDQILAPTATTLYRLSAVIPGQADGTLVVFRFRASDARLGLATVFGEESALTGPRPVASFRYLVGFTRPQGSPRLNELLPRNAETPLPFFDVVPEAERSNLEYVELWNPGTEPFDLAGFYLTDRFDKARLFEFPADGSAVVPPAGFLVAYFGPRPPSLPPDPADPNFVPFLSVTGITPDSCQGRIHLIAPEEKALGANCEVDSLVWDLNPASCPADRAAARVCDGGDSVPQPSESAPSVGRPSPESTNVLPPIFHDAFHTVIRSPNSERNVCVGEGESVQLNAVVFVDAGVREAFRGDPLLLSGAFLVDRGNGEEEITQLDVVVCRPERDDCVAAPPSMVTVVVSPRLPLSGQLPAVVRYRISLTDGCGGMIEEGPFSFGTEGSTHPAVALNEINRFHSVPGFDQPRPWIEIFNASGAEIDLGGMFITDDELNPRQAVFPAGARVPPGGVLVVLTSGNDPTPYPRIDFPWDGEQRGTLQLIDSLERGSCIIDEFPFNFGGLPIDASIGRDPDGSGAPARLDPPSPGRLNGDATFVRGDATNDLDVNVTDIIRELAILFSGDPNRPPCEDALDANDDGLVNATDPVFLADFLFRQGPAIPAPFPGPGFDPTPDSLSPCGVGL